MANVDKPFGLKPVGHLITGSYNGKVNIYYHHSDDAVAIYRGDLVQMNETAGEAEPTGKYPSVIQHVAGQEDNVGVAVGFGSTPQLAAINTNLNSPQYCPGSTAMYIAVVDDPNVIFEIQEDSAGNAVTIDEVGKFADVAVTAGSSTTGTSGMELDSDSAGASGTLRIYRLANREDNAIGDHAKWLVLINEHLWNHNENAIA